MRFLRSAALAIFVSGCIKYPDIPRPRTGACLEQAWHRRAPSENLIGGKAVDAKEIDRLLLDDPRSHAAQRRAKVLDRGFLPSAVLLPGLLLAGAAVAVGGAATGNDTLGIAGLVGGLTGEVLMTGTLVTLGVQSDRVHQRAVAIFNDAAAASGQCPP